MDNITKLLMENGPVQQEPTQCDEKAQIVLHGTYGSHLVLRYRKVRTAEKVFNDLCKAKAAKATAMLAPGDMFDSFIDLTQVTFMSLVDHSKKSKFAPFVQ